MKVQEYGIVQNRLTPAQRWLCFASIFFMAFLASYNLFKASPCITYIAADLAMPKTMVSQIMGSYSIPALVFAFPGMWIAQKFGFKFSTLVCGILMIVGSIFCALTNDATLFLTGRVVEGIGYGIICVIGPNLITRIFPRNQIGVSMGIWSQWLTVGTTVSMFLTPAIFALGGGGEVAFSWKGVWWFAVILEVIACVLVLVFFRMPRVFENTVVDGNEKVKSGNGKNFMVSAMMVGTIFIVFAYLNVTVFNTFYPTFLQEFKGMTVASSSYVTLTASIVSIVLGIAIGVIADKVHSRKWLIGITYLVGILIWGIMLFTQGDGMVLPWIGVILWGASSGIIATLTRAIIPTLVSDPKKSDIALTNMSFWMALGKVIGGYIVSPILVAIGYFANALYICAPLCLVAGVLVLVFVKSDHYVWKIRVKEREEALAAAGIAEEKTE